MSSYKNPVDLSKEIGETIFSPELPTPPAGVSPMLWVKSKEFERYNLLGAYHLIARNYIFNALIQGMITEEEMQEYLKIAATEKGLTSLSAHCVFAAVQSKIPFPGLKLQQAETLVMGKSAKDLTVMQSITKN